MAMVLGLCQVIRLSLEISKNGILPPALQTKMLQLGRTWMPANQRIPKCGRSFHSTDQTILSARSTSTMDCWPQITVFPFSNRTTENGANDSLICRTSFPSALYSLALWADSSATRKWPLEI